MKNLLEPQLHTILQLVEMRVAPALVLRNLLRPLFPESYAIDASVISNVRYKARAILEKRKLNTIASPSESLELGQFVEAIASGDPSHLALDELPPSFIDIASRHANDLLSEILNEGIKDAVLIERYLEALHQKDPGFTYKIAIANDGSRCGYVWMTPAMRRSFELYGDVLFLDMMKRRLNSQHWPYVGPVVLNGNKKIEVAAEGILVTESIAAYDFVVKAMLEMTPNRKKESIKVICGDGNFRGGGLLQTLGIAETCFFVADQYHLLQRDWPDYFKGAWFNLEELFKNYIYSSSEAEVQSRYSMLRQRLGHRTDWMRYLDNEVHAHRKLFVSFYIDRIPGRLNRLGSSPAESNHSSYVFRIGPECSEEPAVAVKDMITRQNDILKERNMYLADYKFRSRALAQKDKVHAIRKARLSLCQWGFTLWFQEWEQSSNYQVEEMEHGGAESHSVHRKGTGEESKRVIVTHGDPCGCSCKVAYGIQCRHDLAINGAFDFGKFIDPERWKLRLLELSSDIGSFVCRPIDLNGSNEDFDDDDDDDDDDVDEDEDEDDVDGLSYNDEPCSTETEPCSGPNEEHKDTDNTREQVEPTAQLVTTKTLSFKNFMDYCHDFASAIWKKPVEERELYAGLIIGLTEEANGDDGSVSPSEDLQAVLQRHRSMFSSSRNDVFTTNPTFKKTGPKASGQPRKKRMIGQTEQARMMKASSSRKRDKQACSFCKMNGCRVSNCILMKGLGGKPLEPHYVSATFTDTLGDPTEHLVEIAQGEFLRSEVGEKELDEQFPPPNTHHLVVERCYFSSSNASAKARPSSRFSLSQQDACSNSDRKGNVVEVVCLAEGGRPIPGCHYLNVGQAIAWMRKYASKTRRVFSKLRDQKQDNPYKRRYGDL
jgi:hypothetical protein